MSWHVRVTGLLACASVLAGVMQPLPAALLPAPPVHGRASAPVHGSLLQARLPAKDADAVTTEPPAVAPPPPAPVDCATVKCVALTMDDGPIGATTALLALLRRKQAPVTFFVIGEQAKAHPATIRRMLADGHAVGSHSWNHPEFWYLSKKALRRQFARTDDVLTRITGRRPTLIRPPYGEVNAKVRSVAKARHEAVVLWDVDPRDWKDRKARTVAKRVLKQARRGSIILTHDIYSSTRHAYARIIDGLRAKGFTLVTVPELLANRARPGKVYLRR